MLHSEFPYIRGKFIFFFISVTTTILKSSVSSHGTDVSKNQFHKELIMWNRCLGFLKSKIVWALKLYTNFLAGMWSERMSPLAGGTDWGEQIQQHHFFSGVGVSDQVNWGEGGCQGWMLCAVCMCECAASVLCVHDKINPVNSVSPHRTLIYWLAQ